MPMTEFDFFVAEEAYSLATKRSNTNIVWHVDHIVAVSKGGTHTASNLQVIPALLNLQKGTKSIPKYLWSDFFK